jgi:hypothetical protein
MDATERELTDLLRRRHEADAVPSPGLAARVLAGAVARRRKRRAQAAAAGAAASVVVVAVAVLWPSAAVRSTGPVAPSPAPSSGAPPRTVSQAWVSRVLPGSEGRFTAFAIDRDGTLAGTDVAYGADGFDRFSTPLVLDPAPPEVVFLDGPDVEFMPSLVADARSVYALRHTDPGHKFDLWCTDRATGRTTQLSDGSVWEATVRTDRGNVVWSYYGDGTDTFAPDEVWTASGCGPARRLPVTGTVVAVDWPSIYVRDPDVAWGVTRVDAVSPASTPVPRPAADVPGPGSTEDRPVVFAAGVDVLAWVLDREVRYLDLRTGRVVRLPDLPVVPGVNGVQPRVTVGDRTVAAFTRGSDAGPDAVAGLVHDLRTGETERVSGDVWAAGPWVVTGERDAYRIRRLG